MERARAAIARGEFAQFRAEFLASYQITDQEARQAQRDKWLKARENEAQ
jgi:queuine/archaeosine tRNA-ribosyltransferase